MTAAQKAVIKGLATHDGTFQFFRPTAKATAGLQKLPKKAKHFDSAQSGLLLMVEELFIGEISSTKQLVIEFNVIFCVLI
jgi:hypothetical protein